MEDKVKIPEEQLHDLRQDIYAWIIANGYAADKEEAKEVAKDNGLITAKAKDKVIIKTVNKEVEVPPKDYDEVKAKANKYNSLKGLMKDLLK